ncbi:MAG: hypothetical protein IJT36_08665 [Alphaproteobacteria bacterium]|nr:hypothetical protein [Alphaproteobacteria bacterium]
MLRFFIFFFLIVFLQGNIFGMQYYDALRAMDKDNFTEVDVRDQARITIEAIIKEISECNNYLQKHPDDSTSDNDSDVEGTGCKYTRKLSSQFLKKKQNLLDRLYYLSVGEGINHAVSLKIFSEKFAKTLQKSGALNTYQNYLKILQQSEQ